MPGYTKFDNPLLEKILTSGFTKRQLKILLLILRFSAGCQKTYAVLRRNDFAYAGISAYCITDELKKLVKLRVIRWHAARDLVWINPNLGEWAVDNPGEKSGDNLRKFFKIASKNLLKRQLAVYQNSKQNVAETTKISSGNKEKLQEGDRGRCGAVLGQLHYFHLTSFQGDCRVVAGLLTPSGTGRVHQCWLTFEHSPRPVGVGVGTEMGLIFKEDLRPPGACASSRSVA